MVQEGSLRACVGGEVREEENFDCITNIIEVFGEKGQGQNDD